MTFREFLDACFYIRGESREPALDRFGLPGFCCLSDGADFIAFHGSIFQPLDEVVQRCFSSVHTFLKTREL